jgi:hypothetical protein
MRVTSSATEKGDVQMLPRQTNKTEILGAELGSESVMASGDVFGERRCGQERGEKQAGLG